jgi:hypothetical protein
MTEPFAPNGRTALVGVRLEDIPVVVRRRFGRSLIEKATLDGDILGAVELTGAVERPSDKVYWLPLSAVMQARERGKW